MRDAEAIVCLAWAEELLRRNDCAALALDAARQECQAASDRLGAAQRYGDPRKIILAHGMLEDALEVHRASEAASVQVHRALETVLDSLARAKKEYIAAAARQVHGGEPEPATAPAATPDPTLQLVLPGGGRPQTVRRALWRVGRLLARRTPGSP